MALEGIGFALGAIPELRHQINSMKTRIENFRQGPDTFRTLSKNVDRLARHIAEVERLRQTFPSTIPLEISTVFNDTLSSVRDQLVNSNSTMEKHCSKAFAASSSSAATTIYRATRAKALHGDMASVDSQIKDASSKILLLISVLANALKIDNTGMAENFEAEYRRATSAPALPHTVNLNFDARNEDGTPATPEGILKHAVLSSEFSAAVTAAAGAINPAYGVVGMAGVGKTIALRGLAFDKDIQNRFLDGVHYMTLGQGATSQTAIRQTAKILRLTGATALVRTVERSSSLSEAVDYAATWFEGKNLSFSH